ncbi:MAG: TIR domain-containing protein [Coleofasciculus sp. B1-GNL1-01]|uniref:TIR domain-containing protein n=1 Tax=Coleofasciculus sp. B1-GNL1-01 TaxID=3068484 RepID=UPI003304978C
MNKFCHTFISYGRADSKAFATKLHKRLLKQGLKVWFDQNDIPLGVDFQNQIDDGIEKAHNFLFIIAPHSVNSPYCGKEIELALKLNKRIIPLLHVEQITQETWQQRNPKGTPQDWEVYQQKGLHSSFPNMHPAIGKINWVYFREGLDDFEASFAGLIDLLHSHADYVDQHTQFLAKALEWERHQKQHSYLLIGEERQQAEAWLKIRFKDEQPPCVPTDLHCEYITESIKNANNLMTQVIISYADEDRAKMEKIRRILRRKSITVWTNTTDIKTGEVFEEAIKRGIEQADNLVYLLSPDSVKSDYAQRELDYAVSLNKRIIPVLVRETPPEQIPSALRELQYIDLTDNVKEEDYHLDESQLLRILQQDAAYYNEHKILLTKALKWKRQHENPSILLQGYNLRSGESWLKVANKRTLHPPTPLIETFIAESLRQPLAESLDAFISYSRVDSDFARKLNDELQLQGKRTWFDQESIALGADFAQEIRQGIKACDNFLFILSPRSVNSPYCKDEVEYAASLNKRFVTVLHREVNSNELHRELAKVQWIDFNKNQRDFNVNFRQLVRTLDTDREHLRSHTKWSQRAIEWEEKGKSADLLLRGSEFAIAENWLMEAEQQKKQPAATSLQKAFIEASQNAIVVAEQEEKRRQATMLRLQEERMKEAEARLAEQIKSARLQKLFLARLSIALVAVSMFAATAFIQYCNSALNEIQAIRLSSEALLALNQDLDGLISTLRASKKIRQIPGYIAFIFRQEEKVYLQKSINRLLQEVVYTVKERNRLEKHTDEVVGVSFSSDGQTIATASADHTVKLWNMEGQELLISPLKGHEALVHSVEFSPDGKTIATASWDGTVKLWTSEGNLITTLDEHKLSVYDVSFSPNGKTLATASSDGTVKLWTSEGKQIRTLDSHSAGVLNVSFSPDGKTIATASADTKVILWSVDGENFQTLSGHKDWVWSVAWSPDGKTLASASRDGTIKLWNKDSEIKTLNDHKSSVTSVSFSPDSKTLASASSDNTVILWSLDGENLQTLSGHKDWVWSVAWSPDGKTLASASKDKTVKLWKVKGKELQILQAHNSAINSISFSDSKIFATVSWDGTAKLWTNDGQVLATLKGHTEPVYSASFSPNGNTLATASWDHTVKLWSRDGKELQTLSGHKGKVYSVVWSPNGKTLATAHEDGSVALWSLDSKLLQIIEGHDDIVNSVSFNPDGKIIATASWDTTAKLWTNEGKPITTLEGHTDGVHSVTFSPDGKLIATASEDKTAKLWTSEGQFITTLKGHDAGVSKVSFSPDSETIATASLDKSVKLWSRDGNELKTYKGHDEQVYGLSFSPNGQILASSDNAGQLILFNLDLEPDDLVQYGCQWVRDYLKNNPNVSKSDRTLCD